MENVMKRKILPILAVIALGAFAACVTPMGMTASTTPLEGKKIEQNLGKAEGSDSTWSLFGIWSMGRPDIDEAIREAVTDKGGDAMINVRWYEKTYYLVLFSVTRLIVTGEVVKFEAAAPVPKTGRGR